MRIIDHSLLVLLGLVGLTGLAITLPLGEGQPRLAAPIDALPQQFDGWVAVEGVPEEILPHDPRALQAVRRTYTKEGHTVHLVVARYPSRNHPEGRPSLNLIAPERGAIAVQHDLLWIPLDGVPGRMIPVQRLLLKRPERPISVVYWYQLGEETIAGHYRFRLALFLDTLLFRRREVLLVRAATIGSERPEPFLWAFYPRLLKILSS